MFEEPPDEATIGDSFGMLASSVLLSSLVEGSILLVTSGSKLKVMTATC